jgi:hypothetical protein
VEREYHLPVLARGVVVPVQAPDDGGVVGDDAFRVDGAVPAARLREPSREREALALGDGVQALDGRAVLVLDVPRAPEQYANLDAPARRADERTDDPPVGVGGGTDQVDPALRAVDQRDDGAAGVAGRREDRDAGRAEGARVETGRVRPLRGGFRPRRDVRADRTPRPGVAGARVRREQSGEVAGDRRVRDADAPAPVVAPADAAGRPVLREDESAVVDDGVLGVEGATILKRSYVQRLSSASLGPNQCPTPTTGERGSTCSSPPNKRNAGKSTPTTTPKWTR